MLQTPMHYPYVVGYRPRKKDENSLTLLFFVFDSNLMESPKVGDVAERARSVAKGEVTDDDIRGLRKQA
jgi:hypothetical protein